MGRDYLLEIKSKLLELGFVSIEKPEFSGELKSLPLCFIVSKVEPRKNYDARFPEKEWQLIDSPKGEMIIDMYLEDCIGKFNCISFSKPPIITFSRKKKRKW